MVTVEYDSVKKAYGETIAIEDIDLEVDDGEFTILLGPSGCGKTTTLRCLAGLTEPTSGTITLDGHDVTNVHPKNRNIAMVFQNFALYPHMTVRENIGYPLKVADVDKEERENRIEQVAETLEIPELLDRDIANLSGGQQQRVALGRAIIRRPAVFLMDEPLANLDAKLKISMRSRIKVLQREMDITTLYVTHDQEEAMSLGDKLVVMDQGNIQQIGSPDEVYHQPVNRFVAGFIGSPSMNFIEVTHSEGQIQAVDAPAAFDVTLDDAVTKRYSGTDEMTLGVRPQYFTIHTDETANAVEAEVEVTEPQGDEQIVEVAAGDVSLTIVAPSTIDTTRGDTVWLTLEDELVHGFDPDTGDRIGDPEEMVATTRASSSAGSKS
ncbi:MULTISPECIES: ABC transporter ATP-binding protein [Haloarcula]|uniref:ABC-type D-xylose/L-arabinose transporter n=1 Tax=Haloarcula pellucida TaxID=1427151 RepID=A0A830GLX7_9EURY|nr:MULTISPECIES: ABC transporter ATP-binding protein [Halomicroarcula]MBX0349798.1 ABC transporter ATP-binding protein [Halomicroarcula pellucida]MDS0279541.1 ABC transporter ATP-binding protein [Halomicroarcula sp. S1AR25-4]GGN94402.1 ABC transporter ATP-binding protein [Halomicroarcula pellucida]